MSNMWVAVPKFMRLAIPGGFNIAGTNATPSTYNTTGFQFSEDVSMVRGAHQIGFGADWIKSFLAGTSLLNATGPLLLMARSLAWDWRTSCSVSHLRSRKPADRP